MADLIVKLGVLVIGFRALNAIKNRIFRKPKVHHFPDNFTCHEDDKTKELNKSQDSFNFVSDRPAPLIDSNASLDTHEPSFSEETVNIQDDEGSVCRSLATCLSRTLSNLTEEEEIKLFLDQWEEGADSPTLYEDSLYLNEDHKYLNYSPDNNFDSEAEPSLFGTDIGFISTDKIESARLKTILRNALDSELIEEDEDEAEVGDDNTVVENVIDSLPNLNENLTEDQCIEELLLNLITSSSQYDLSTFEHNCTSERNDAKSQELMFEYDDCFKIQSFYDQDYSMGEEACDFDSFDNSLFTEDFDSISISEVIKLMEQEQQMENAEVELLHHLEMIENCEDSIQDFMISRADSISDKCTISSIEEDNNSFFSQLLQIIDSSNHMVAEIDDLFLRDETINQFLESTDYFSESFSEYGHGEAEEELAVSYSSSWIDLILEPSPMNSVSPLSNQLKKSSYSWSEETTFMEEMKSKLKKISISPSMNMFNGCQLEPCGWCGSMAELNCCGWRAATDDNLTLQKTVSAPS